MASDDTTVIRKGNFVTGGKTVEAGRGWEWIAEGWQLFKKAPGLWIGMTLVALVIYIGVSLIPILGMIATTVLWPVFGAGMVLASARLDRGEPAQFSDLFAGFRVQFGRLAGIGALYLVGSIAILAVFVMIAGVGVLSMGRGESAATPQDLTTLLLALLVVLALSVPLLMAVWFATPLVLFHDQGSVAAMQGSFAGCLRNIVPFLVYGVIGFIFAVLASIPLGLGWLILGPVFIASIYTGYRDIYLS